jgi:hypothetical protein
MVIDNRDVVGAIIEPPEDESPLLVDTDGVKASQVASKDFKAVSWWTSQVDERSSGVQNIELA